MTPSNPQPPKREKLRVAGPNVNVCCTQDAKPKALQESLSVVREVHLRQLVGFTRVLSGYGCAGVDQDPDDTTLCGKCGPCEAGEFLKRIGEAHE